MVGDEDQSIYGFRAAYPKALIEFNKTYKKSKVLLMETNYRSTRKILNAANAFIKQNKNRKDKNIIPFVKDEGKIEHKIFNTIEEEYEYLLLQARKNKNKKIAVLYRNNDSAIPIIDIFNKNNIKFTIKESDANFFAHNIVKDIKSFIKFYIEPTNMDSFQKIYYKINCGISKNQVNSLIRYMNKRKNYNILDNLIRMDETVYWQRKKLKEINLEFLLWKRKNSYGIVKSIFKVLEYEKYLKKKTQDINIQKLNVIYSLAKQNPDILDFLDKLDELENKIKEGSKENPNIVLSTIHGSKGLEYDRVFIIDAIKGVLPSVEKTEDEKSEEFEIYEEEVRLFYVAMTRAKNSLEILTYKTAFGEEIEESSFVKDIFDKRIDK